MRIRYVSNTKKGGCPGMEDRATQRNGDKGSF